MRLTEPESRRRLTSARVALLGVNDSGGSPLAVPVTFAVVERDDHVEVGFAVDHKPKASTRLRRLDLIARDPRVTLLVHDYDEDWRRLWWARADGTATIHPAAGDGPRAAMLDALGAKYRQYRERPPDGDVVLVAVERLTGWSGEDLDGN